MKFALVTVFCSIFANASAFAEARELRIPGEYDQGGSSARGMLNVGTTEADGITAIQVNPAILALTDEYSVGVSYHWADLGRDYYRAGVVDAVTSKVAAGFSYTGFQEDPEDRFLSIETRDSSALKRASLGLAYPTKFLALGVSAYYTEGVEDGIAGKEVVKGLSLGLGLAGYILPNVKFGVSSQNLNNQKVAELAPRFIRVGVSWDVVPEWLLFLDYRDRQRVNTIEGEIAAIPGLGINDEELKGYETSEKMVFLGSRMTVYDLIRIEAVYGSSVEPDDDRSSFSAGIGIHQKNYSFSYAIANSYLEYSDLQSAISLQVHMSL